MGGIPLPALQTQTNYPSPLDEYMRASQLRGQQQQQALQQQEITLRNQQIKDQTALTSAMRDWDPNAGYDDLEKKAMTYGASGNAALQIRQHAMDIQKTSNALTQEQRDNYVKNSKAFGDQLQGTEQLPDEQLHDGAANIVMGAIRNKILDPQEGQSYLAGIQRTTDPTALRQQIDHISKLKQGASAVMEQQKTQAQTEEAAQRGAESKAKAAQLNIELQGLKGITPDYINQSVDSVYDPNTNSSQNRMTKQQAMLALNRGDVQGAKKVLSDAFEKELGARSTIEAETDPRVMNARENMAAVEAREKLRIEAQGVAGINLTPAQKNTVAAINEGRETPPSGYALSTPYWQAIMGGVTTLDPQWSEQRSQLRKGYTQDKEIGAINTALGHAGVLNDAIDALNNGRVPILNSLANRLGVEVGKDPVTTFKTIVHRVGPEISKAYLGAGGSAGERGSDEKDFDENLAPNQLKNNVSMTTQLLGSKIASKAYQWDVNKSDSMPSFNDRFLMPGAQNTLDRLAPRWKDEQKSATAPRASGTPKTAEEFMRKHNINPQQTQANP